MRIVFDTNVLVATYTAHGTCFDLIAHCVDRHTMVVTEFILAEFQRVLIRKFKFPPEKALAAAENVRTGVVCVAAGALESPVCRDPDDDNVLAAAAASACDCIVTGDNDLLCLTEFEGIPIIAPADFWRFESTTTMQEEDPQ